MVVALLSLLVLVERRVHAVVEQVVELDDGLLPDTLVLAEEGLRNALLVDDVVQFLLVAHLDLDPHHVQVLHVEEVLLPEDVQKVD